MAATVRTGMPYGRKEIAFDVPSANLQGIYEPRQVPPARIISWMVAAGNVTAADFSPRQNP